MCESSVWGVRMMCERGPKKNEIIVTSDVLSSDERSPELPPRATGACRGARAIANTAARCECDPKPYMLQVHVSREVSHVLQQLEVTLRQPSRAIRIERIEGSAHLE